MTRRTERVSEEVRAELARLIQTELTDPRIGFVTLTRVDLSPDFRNARVDWSRFGPTPKDQPSREEAEQAALDTQAGLESASGFLRSALARALPLKRVPELRFHHDTSLEEGARTLELIAEMKQGSETAADDAPAGTETNDGTE